MLRPAPRLLPAAFAIAACLAPWGGTAAAAGGGPASKAVQVAVGGSGGVGAVLSYREGVGGPLPYFNLRLSITRGGASAYEAAVGSAGCASGCEPQALDVSALPQSPLALADLEGNGESDVVLGLRSGGAHCCTIVQVFLYDPGVMAYRVVEHDFGDPGARLSGIVSPLFVSGDDRFAYTFAPYSGSAFPLALWQLRDGRFANVTRAHPAAIATDAARFLRGFRAGRARGEGLGAIAAWAADEELLGHDRLVRATLSREAAAGRLRSREHYGASGKAFVTALLRFLKRTGYRR